MSKLDPNRKAALDLAQYEPELLTEFLALLRDKYPIVDRANFYLEQHLGVSSINVSITNQRDAVSHLVSFLSNTTATDVGREFREQQIYAAEEHLRRATMEPYQIVVMEKLNQLSQVLEDYDFFVLSRHTGDDSKTSRFTREEVESADRRIRQLYEKGRLAKTKNYWDSEWEEGILCFIEAIQEIERLRRQLMPSIDAAKASVFKRKSLIMRFQLFGVGVLCGIGVMLVVVLLMR